MVENGILSIVNKVLMVITVLVFMSPVKAFAQVPSSSNYQVPESTFSTGSEIDANSASYNARATAGVLAIGLGESTNYSARPGFVTPDEEFLEFVVQTASVDLGTLSTSTTGSGTANFYVRSYINGSYVVYTLSTAPSSEGGATLNPLVAATTSTVGTEQFGINLVDNASPNIGVDPTPNPSTQFANGEASTGYETVDNYKYLVGDVIARSGAVGPAWGRTDFTISYIANISSITEAGTYTMDHDIVVTATF